MSTQCELIYINVIPTIKKEKCQICIIWKFKISVWLIVKKMERKGVNFGSVSDVYVVVNRSVGQAKWAHRWNWSFHREMAALLMSSDHIFSVRCELYCIWRYLVAGQVQRFGRQTLNTLTERGLNANYCTCDNISRFYCGIESY